MRILKLSDVYFPRVNGVSTAIRTFAREFAARGHQVTLAAPAYPANGPNEPFDVLRLNARRLPLDPEDRLITGAAARRLKRQLGGRDFDVIHIHTPFRAHYLGVALGRRWRVPVVETYHTYFEQYLEDYLPFMPARLLRMAARRFSVSQANAVDALVVPSQPMLDVLRGYGVHGRAEVIPTGLPASELPEGDGKRFRLANGIPLEVSVLLYVGRVAHEKNIDFLIRMFAEVHAARPQTRLLIAGEGPAEHSLKQLTNRLGLASAIHFIGYLDRGQALSDCYAAGDLFVFASRTETQGLVLLESMKLGTPVVTTAVMGTAALMADHRGGVVAPEQQQAFAELCVGLIDTPETRRMLAEDARRKAAEWDAGRLADRLLGLYADLMSLREVPSQASISQGKS